MRTTATIEKTPDGHYSCLVDDYKLGIAGYGDSAEEAKTDMLECYEEMKEIMSEEGKTMPELEFVYHYDIQSFFNYFSFLNKSEIARKAGINESQMRRYASGATASEAQYDKLRNTIREITEEMAVAVF